MISKHIVRDILVEADDSTIKVLNALSRYWEVPKAQLKWARKVDNCKKLLGQFPRADLEAILRDLKRQYH